MHPNEVYLDLRNNFPQPAEPKDKVKETLDPRGPPLHTFEAPRDPLTSWALDTIF